MEAKDFKEKILKEYPRMKKNDSFGFACHKNISCFNKCCNDVNIFLTPYDIIRLKNRLGISSGEFLDKYTIIPLEENLQHPVVMFRMDDDTLDCRLVGDQGCAVYEDRPWSCRMFPVGVASPKAGSGELDEEFYFLLEEDVCQGFNENNQWTVAEWIDNQRAECYVTQGDIFKEISLHDKFLKGMIKEPIKLEMFFTVCYNIDKFRDLVFKSAFFRRFKVDENRIAKMKEDDVELLKFGYDFLKFSLFGEQTLELTDDYKKAFDMKNKL